MIKHFKKYLPTPQGSPADWFVYAVWEGSGRDSKALRELFEKLINIKDRAAFQDVVQYFKRYIDKNQQRFFPSNYPIMTSERGWEDCMEQIFTVLKRYETNQ